MRKPSIIVWLMLAIGVLSVRGQNEADVLVVNLKNQQTAEFRLESKPDVRFENDAMLVSAPGLTGTLSYAIADISHISFVSSGAVTDVNADLSFEIVNGHITVRGLDNGQAVDIYDASGINVAHGVADGTGECSVSTDALKSGVYIVTAGGVSYKIMR